MIIKSTSCVQSDNQTRKNRTNVPKITGVNTATQSHLASVLKLTLESKVFYTGRAGRVCRVGRAGSPGRAGRAIRAWLGAKANIGI